MALFVILLMPPLVFGESFTIQSENVGSRGIWGKLEKCPPGYFIKAINIKVKSIQDLASLSNVRLSCVSLNQQMTSEDISGSIHISSAQVPWGDFQGVEYCLRGVATGFQLRTKSDGNDAVANDLVLICTNRTGEHKTKAKGGTSGEWQTEKRCPPRTALCGLQIKVKETKGRGDDASLNTVRMVCCELPNPAALCNPSDNWRVIYRHNNTLGTSAIKYKLREQEGVRKTNVTTHPISVIEEIAESVGYTLEYTMHTLENTFKDKLSTSHNTGYEWYKAAGSVFSSDHYNHIQSEIPPKCFTTISQVVGECGPYTVHVNSFKNIDKC